MHFHVPPPDRYKFLTRDSPFLLRRIIAQTDCFAQAKQMACTAPLTQIHALQMQPVHPAMYQAMHIQTPWF